MKSPIHLGDGAYCQIDEVGMLVVTANHHDPNKTDRAVFIEPEGILKLVNYLEDYRVELENRRKGKGTT